MEHTFEQRFVGRIKIKKQTTFARTKRFKIINQSLN